MSEASSEVANLTEMKNPPHINGVKEFVCLFVTKFDPNYLRTGRTEWAEFFFGHLWQKGMSQKKILSVKWPVEPKPRAKTATF